MQARHGRRDTGRPESGADSGRKGHAGHAGQLGRQSQRRDEGRRKGEPGSRSAGDRGWEPCTRRKDSGRRTDRQNGFGTHFPRFESRS